jgi:hypothetical protein
MNKRESLAKTGGRTPHVPVKTPAPDAAGPPFNVNLTQITSDEKGHVDTSEFMHKWFQHACKCGMEE